MFWLIVCTVLLFRQQPYEEENSLVGNDVTIITQQEARLQEIPHADIQLGRMLHQNQNSPSDMNIMVVVGRRPQNSNECSTYFFCRRFSCCTFLIVIGFLAVYAFVDFRRP